MSKGLYGILSSLRKEKKEVRILMLGLDNSGKTSILKALSKEDATQVTTTLGFNIKNLSIEGLKLNVWDIGGQKAIRDYWSNYFEGTTALCYVVDSADPKRLQESRDQLMKLISEPDLDKVPILVFANKQDLAASLPYEQIQKLIGLDDIKNHDWSIIPCSARTHEGLEDGIEWLANKVK